MENQDKLYEQFQQASKKAESNNFAAMDKVWERVEDKLDRNVLKKESTLWRKIAIAASFLLLMTFGYQFLNQEKTVEIIPDNSLASPAKEEKFLPVDVVKKEAIVSTEKRHPLIKDNATQIIQEKLKKQQDVAFEETTQAPALMSQEDAIAEEQSDELAKKEEQHHFATQKFNSVSVMRNNAIAPHNLTQKADEAVAVQEKSNPLVILDGKAMEDVSAKSYLYGNQENFETIAILPNPLFIINGVEYTEQELFGPNPSSPYHPLTKQEILSTSILQGESATNLYGEKGKQGVVIITTKNGKPLKK